MLNEVQDKKWLTLEQGADIINLKGKVDELDARVNQMSVFEDVLGMNGEGDFETMFTLKTEYQTRYSLWNSIDQFEALSKEWELLQFKTIDAKPMIQKTEQFIRVVNQAERNLSENPVVPKLKNMVWQYKDALPAVLALRSPFLEPEHWESIRALMNVDIDPEDSRLKLRDLLAFNINNFAPELIEISTQALQ